MEGDKNKLEEAGAERKHPQTCTVCEGLERGRGISPRALISSAKEHHCLGCKIIYGALVAFDVDLAMPDLSIWIPEQGSFRILVDSMPKWKGLDLELFTFEGEASQFREISPASEVTGNTASEQGLQKAQTWMQQCVKSHPSCSSNSQAALPSRVLDLSLITPNTDGLVLLLESRNRYDKYACLSHRWGSNMPLRTTRANYEEHKAGIPYNLLPKTYQDAIMVSRKLDIQYLWIDSLCIIQDDELDWERESANMASIYSNSHVTIAASSSSGPTDGFFVAAPEYISRSVNLAGPDGKEYSVHVRPSLQHGNWPLLKRGWVFQERLLSPRVLHFGHAELVWECLNQLACECSRCTESGSQELNFIVAQKHRLNQSILSSPSRHRSLPDHWRELVSIYSRMDLTYPKDIFPALSGAVKHFRQYRKSRYIAGLWEDTLVEDLLWASFDWRTTLRPAEWRSPTWSWASIMGGAEYQFWNASSLKPGSFGVEHSYVQVIEADCKPSGLDPDGNLKSSYIRLAGRITLTTISYDMLWYADRQSEINYCALHIPGSEAEISFSNFHLDYDICRPGRWYVQSGTPLYCLKMASAAYPSGNVGIFYLVLKCISEENQVYERIGHCEDAANGASPRGKLEDTARNMTVTIV